jgi:formate C-acetyltransferase
MYVDTESKTQNADAPSNPWHEFKSGQWQTEVNVRDFIQCNHNAYTGDEGFLQDATEDTLALWNQVSELIIQEHKTGAPIDFDTKLVSSITSHGPGYINKDKETIVGLQTEAPLKRAMLPLGGIRMVEGSCKAYDKTLDPEVKRTFTEFRKTHNAGVFDAYTEDMLKVRKAGIITGLPDAYGRGRIIGDYRRVALYGVDALIEDKMAQKKSLTPKNMDAETIQLREEISEQIRALHDIKTMAESYGYDISKPARTAHEAIQWTYFAYLAAIKSQNGAAMSLGRVSTFFDIYFERDIKNGLITEVQAQEMIDHFVMKLRMVRFLRTPEYDELFSGDPTWVTESIGGMGNDGRTLVSKTSYRVLHTLYNLGPAPEPNLTVLWSDELPETFKHYCAKVSRDTSAVQYENDDTMRKKFGDDYGIACCVSAMAIGKQMQFFGARCNLAKTMLYGINGGLDEVKNMQVGPKLPPLDSEVLDYQTVWDRFETYMDWVATEYINALNVIHYMHDKYCYESALMALHDKEVYRTMACGVAGLSIVADSLSAIKYATVRPIRNDDGMVVDYDIEGDFPKFGNNDGRVDEIANKVLTTFLESLKKNKTYRNAHITQSVLTITSNIVYGKKTGATPDGRKGGEPFAPGANPMHGRDEKGALASLLSVAHLPYDAAEDGISYTLSIGPNNLGKSEHQQMSNMCGLLDGYFQNDGHHINVNVLNRDTLVDAMEHPEKYPQLTLRVSGYAVNFNRLTREQQLDVINRTFHRNL